MREIGFFSTGPEKIKAAKIQTILRQISFTKHRYKNIGGTEAIGDAFKLYWHFDRFYNNDNVTLFVSIALTVFLYFVTTFSAGALLYVYFLKIHNNGRLMDVFWRWVFCFIFPFYYTFPCEDDVIIHSTTVPQLIY